MIRRALPTSLRTISEPEFLSLDASNKERVCHQCSGLRDGAGEGHRGADLVQIEVAPGLAVTAESLFDARLEIVRNADLEYGPSHILHDLFFTALTKREEAQ